jgi:hypothetical protein
VHLEVSLIILSCATAGERRFGGRVHDTATVEARSVTVVIASRRVDRQHYLSDIYPVCHRARRDYWL